ncbi:Galactosylceramide sulfotransferase, partial [Penaeus vannamei]
GVQSRGRSRNVQYGAAPAEDWRPDVGESAGVRTPDVLCLRGDAGAHRTLHRGAVHLQSLPQQIGRSFAPPDWLTRDPDACRPSANIAFLKTHKCASSAVQNILFRYGYAHGLQFALPDHGNYFGGAVSFKADMLRLTPWYKLGVNIFAIHTKWDYEQVKSVMPNDTVYISIVREPTELFESLYTYVKFENFYKKTLEEFVASEDADGERYQKYLWYNQMAWDFGLPAEAMTDLDAVQQLVDAADKQFGLVMVAERMDESLVLLSHFLCWDLSDVVVLKVNARSSKDKPERRDSKQRSEGANWRRNYLIKRAFHQEVRPAG